MKDRFSSQAGLYAAFRPTYPSELFQFIFKSVLEFDQAWDAGTGNGQVARDLAPVFSKVMATDISEHQLRSAFQAPNIFYSIAGETTSFPDKSFSLITVAQAIHWFDISKFYREVSRVARPGAIFAVWGYGLVCVDQTIDPDILQFYTAVVGPYWDKERKLIDDHYSTLPFPFTEIKVPEFSLSFKWSLDEFHGYLSTWSSVSKYKAATGLDPVAPFISKIAMAWGTEARLVRFPVFLKMTRLE